MTLHRQMAACVAFLALSTGLAIGAKEVDMETYERWDKEAVRAFEKIAVQDGGRVKPVYTLARVNLLRFVGSRSATVTVRGDNGKPKKLRLSPTEVLMDITLRPEVARQVPLFGVNDSAAVSAIGAKEHEKRRSRYTYAELIGDSAEIDADPSSSPTWKRLRRLAMDYSRLEDRERDGKQSQIIDLYRNISIFENLVNEFRFLRFDPADYVGEDVPKELKGATVTSVLKLVPNLLEKQQGDQELKGSEPELIALDALMAHAQWTTQRNARTLPFFAPADKKAEEWLAGVELLDRALLDYRARDMDAANDKIAKLKVLEDLVSAGENGKDIKPAVNALAEKVTAGAEPRGEIKGLGTELALYRGKYISNSKFIFVFAFIFAALSWLSPATGYGQWMRRIAMGIAWIAVAFLVYGIVLRCIVMERPPIGKLYETIIFIAATAAILGLLFEGVVKNHIALAVAILAGAALVWIGELYEATSAEDTMDPLVAVLRSTFWLSTHVVIITLGYTAGIFAGLLSHVYIFGKLFGAEKDNPQFYRTLTRMVYGVICFAMLFSIVGTILGGIWGNYSWGRFWGWDPKENGAFLIVLMNLIIVHSRLGGLIRDLGLHMLSIIGGCIVVFSWFYVNNMGVGLHSYGFTSGIVKAVFFYWATQTVVLVFGVAVFFMERSAALERKAAKKAKLSDPEPSTA